MRDRLGSKSPQVINCQCIVKALKVCYSSNHQNYSFKGIDVIQIRLIFSIIVLVITTPVFAQSDACPSLVEQALTIIDEACGDLGRNVACYGHGHIDAKSIEEEPLGDFSTSGDITDIEDIYTLATAPMRVEEDVWGIAILSLQANLPGTIPGQAVTFLLYGDAQITSDTDEQNEKTNDDDPFQAFRYTSGIGEPQCAEAPHDGLLIQSPEGVTVNFTVNGIDITLGSTVLIQSNNNATSFTNIEGSVTISAGGVSQSLDVGQSLTVNTIDGVVQAPPAPTQFSMQVISSAPVASLPQQVPLPTPVGQTFYMGFCYNNDTVNIKAQQPITFINEWWFTDASLLQVSEHILTLNGTPIPIWALISIRPSSEGDLGWDLRYVLEPLEVGTYEMIYTSPAYTMTCNLVVQ